MKLWLPAAVQAIFWLQAEIYLHDTIFMLLCCVFDPLPDVISPTCLIFPWEFSVLSFFRLRLVMRDVGSELFWNKLAQMDNNINLWWP